MIFLKSSVSVDVNRGLVETDDGEDFVGTFFKRVP